MVDEKPETTTIRVSLKTHKKLTLKCLKSESYDDLIQRLMFDETKKPSQQKAKYEDSI
jgi:hypothetical protein